MMEYGDSMIRAEWDALMEREREAAHEGTGDLRPPFFVVETVGEIHEIVEAKVGAVEVERIVEGGSGHIPDLDSLLRAKRAAHRERELQARLDAFHSAFVSVLEQTLDGDRLVARAFADGSQRFIEAVAAVAPRGKPSHLQLVSRLVLLLLLNPPAAHEQVMDTITQLEDDGFYDFGFGEVDLEALLQWLFNQQRINAAFKVAQDALSKIEDRDDRIRVRKGLRDRLNRHIRLRDAAFHATSNPHVRHDAFTRRL